MLQLRDIMSLLVRLSQNDADHVRQVLLSNPELSVALVCAAERLQLLDQPLKHAVTQAPAPAPAAASATASAGAIGGGAATAYRPPSNPNAPPPPPPVNLPIEVQQALEMLLRECAPSPNTNLLHGISVSFIELLGTPYSVLTSCSTVSFIAWRKSTSFVSCHLSPKTACEHWAGEHAAEYIPEKRINSLQVRRAAVAHAWLHDEKRAAVTRASRGAAHVVGGCCAAYARCRCFASEFSCCGEREAACGR
jgi:hypothetical protein